MRVGGGGGGGVIKTRRECARTMPLDENGGHPARGTGVIGGSGVIDIGSRVPSYKNLTPTLVKSLAGYAHVPHGSRTRRCTPRRGAKTGTPN